MVDVSWDVVVVGAGAAGLMAAIRSAQRGRRTLLLEKNRKPGVKILMSGGTRCNLTHATDNRGIVEAFGPSGKFLHSALAAFSVQNLIDWFTAEGVPTKVEATGKIFPVSNKATDVLAALLRALARSGAKLALAEPVLALEAGEAGLAVTTASGRILGASIVLTTGGRSYPGSGTTGDGYDFAARLGHTIVAPRPALVPLTVDADWVASLRGVTLPDVLLRIFENDRCLASRRGSFLFAHFGLSGPVVLDVSRVVSGHRHPEMLALEIDFVPEIIDTAVEDFLRGESLTSGKKQLSAILAEHLPRRLGESFLMQSGMAIDRKAAGLTRMERKYLVEMIKRHRLPITGTLGFKKAEVTAGGVALSEVDSRTMRSKLVPDLFVAGEVLDLDGPIGGYNFQSAFSTGWLAGNSA